MEYIEQMLPSLRRKPDLADDINQQLHDFDLQHAARTDVRHHLDKEHSLLMIDVLRLHFVYGVILQERLVQPFRYDPFPIQPKLRDTSRYVKL